MLLKVSISLLAGLLALLACKDNEQQTERGGFKLGTYRPRVNTASAQTNATSSANSLKVQAEAGKPIYSASGERIILFTYPLKLTINGFDYSLADPSANLPLNDNTSNNPLKLMINNVNYGLCWLPAKNSDVSTVVTTSTLVSTAPAVGTGTQTTVSTSLVITTNIVVSTATGTVSATNTSPGVNALPSELVISSQRYTTTNGAPSNTPIKGDLIINGAKYSEGCINL